MEAADAEMNESRGRDLGAETRKGEHLRLRNESKGEGLRVEE